MLLKKIGLALASLLFVSLPAVAQTPAGIITGRVGDATGLALPRSQIVLPIGISFFSFQLISYLVDRLRGEAPLIPPRDAHLGQPPGGHRGQKK